MVVFSFVYRAERWPQRMILTATVARPEWLLR